MNNRKDVFVFNFKTSITIVLAPKFRTAVAYNPCRIEQEF